MNRLSLFPYYLVLVSGRTKWTCMESTQEGIWGLVGPKEITCSLRSHNRTTRLAPWGALPSLSLPPPLSLCLYLISPVRLPSEHDELMAGRQKELAFLSSCKGTLIIWWIDGPHWSSFLRGLSLKA